MNENNDTYFVGIRFRGSDKSYYFSTTFNDLKINDLVMVETVSGLEMGTVCTTPVSTANYHSELALKPILRKPTQADLNDYNFAIAQSKKALLIVQKEAKKLDLPMDFLDAVYNLEGTYVTITYTSPEKRVDFRELLRKIAPLLKARVELRQIASRDKAKMIGGLGICGLPLCCSTFLNQFEGISIAKAKNQMLTLNIPKLSGPCGKLICCLAFEDEVYTEAKKEFPRLGSVVHLEEGDYTVDSMNIISRNVRLANSDRSDFKTVSLEDYRAMVNGTYKPKIEVIKAQEYSLPDFHIAPAESFEREEKKNNTARRDNRNERSNNSNGDRRDGHKNGSNDRHDSRENRRNDRNDRNDRRNNGGNNQNRNQGKQPNGNSSQNRQGGQSNQRQGNGGRHHNHGHNRPNNLNRGNGGNKPANGGNK